MRAAPHPLLELLRGAAPAAVRGRGVAVALVHRRQHGRRRAARRLRHRLRHRFHQAGAVGTQPLVRRRLRVQRPLRTRAPRLRVRLSPSPRLPARTVAAPLRRSRRAPLNPPTGPPSGGGAPSRQRSRQAQEGAFKAFPSDSCACADANARRHQAGRAERRRASRWVRVRVAAAAAAAPAAAAPPPAGGRPESRGCPRDRRRTGPRAGCGPAGSTPACAAP
jgi:hypothetical protein